MDATIEFTEQEIGALLLLVKLGMDYYEGNEDSDGTLAALGRVPNPVLGRVVAKLSRAGTQASRGDT